MDSPIGLIKFRSPYAVNISYACAKKNTRTEQNERQNVQHKVNDKKSLKNRHSQVWMNPYQKIGETYKKRQQARYATSIVCFSVSVRPLSLTADALVVNVWFCLRIYILPEFSYLGIRLWCLRSETRNLRCESG